MQYVITHSAIRHNTQCNTSSHKVQYVITHSAIRHDIQCNSSSAAQPNCTSLSLFTCNIVKLIHIFLHYKLDRYFYWFSKYLFIFKIIRNFLYFLYSASRQYKGKIIFRRPGTNFLVSVFFCITCLKFYYDIKPTIH